MIDYYAGIGARRTPLRILRQMSELALSLRYRGFTLRSGGATGADSAFATGAHGMSAIFVEADGARYPEAMRHAAQFHPKWDLLGPVSKALHARNSLIMLGTNLDAPVRFVVCWTPHGNIAGGTGQAMRIALALGIPIYNLAVMSAAEVLPLAH